MNVFKVQVTIDCAFPALVDKLAHVTGVTLRNVDADAKTVTVTYEECAVLQVSDAIKGFLFNDWIFQWLRTQLQETHRQLTSDELEYLILVFLHEVRSGAVTAGHRTYSEWVARAQGALGSLMRTNSRISLDGFVRFRLRPLITGLNSMLQERVRQFMLDREYEESIEMLRYMLEAQPAGEQELHVFCVPDRVWITDATGHLVRDTEVTEAALSESSGDLNSEDLAMSILITRSPCQIVLHNMDQNAVWPSFPETLVRVFAERVRLCGHCSTCQQLELAQHHLPMDNGHEHRFRRNH